MMGNGNTRNAHVTLQTMNDQEKQTVFAGIAKHAAQDSTLRRGDIVYRFASKHDATRVDAGSWWVGRADFERVLSLESEMHRLIGYRACLGLGFIARVVLDIHWEWGRRVNWLIKARVSRNINVVAGNAARHPWEPFTLQGIETQLLLALATITDGAPKSVALPSRHDGPTRGKLRIADVFKSLDAERRLAQPMALRLKNAQQAVKHIYIPNVRKGGLRETQAGTHEPNNNVWQRALTIVGSPRPVRSYPYELPYGCGDGFRRAVTS